MIEQVIKEEQRILNDMTQELETAKSYSMPLVSGFKVGSVVRGKSGRYYKGANLEVTTHYNLHAEQSAIHNAYINGEETITHVIVTALPCGHCRQFLYGINPDMIVYVEDSKYLLKDLIPEPFSKKDLGITNIVKPLYSVIKNVEFYTIMGLSLLSCQAGYSPLLKTNGGVAILANGKKYCGTFIEDPALNPSILPIMGALSQLFLDNGNTDDITDISVDTVAEVENSNSMLHYNNTVEIAKYLGVDKNIISHNYAIRNILTNEELENERD